MPSNRKKEVDEFIPGLTAVKGYNKVNSPQYKLYAFIEKHFRGNISAAARKIGISKFHLIQIVNVGMYGSMSANRVIRGLKAVDPDVTFDSLFIRPKYKKIEKKKKEVEHAKPIPPKVGSVHSIGTGLFSMILERNR